MDFLVTPEEALPCAQQLLAYLEGQGRRVNIEKSAWEDTPYRTTLYTQHLGEISLYEVQGRLTFHSRLVSFSQWLAANRHYARLYLVVEGSSAMAGETLGAIKKAGVGLMLLQEDGTFDYQSEAKNHALIIVPDPQFKLGDLKNEVIECVNKFNNNLRKDGLRDLCELIERETEKILLVAEKRGLLTLSIKDIKGKDWNGQIDTLGSDKIFKTSHTAYVDTKLKADLHSFRGARNLVDHKVQNKREDQNRQKQYLERMIMGYRLASELGAIRRKIR